MKAYSVTEKYEHMGCIVWADNATEAKRLLHGTEHVFDAEWIDLRAKRLPDADELFYGSPVCDWDTEKGQRIYYKMGWWLTDCSECQECYSAEFPLVPESKLNDDGYCPQCAEELAEVKHEQLR